MRASLWLLPWLLAAAPLSGQGPGGLELGLGVVAIGSDPAFAGAGPALALRPPGRLRFLLAAAPGVEGGAFAFRGELLGQFLLAPERHRGAGIFLVGGVGASFGRADRGVVVVGLGLEGTPGGRSGWTLEAGVGGGARVAAGWRIRWLNGAGPGR